MSGSVLLWLRALFRSGHRETALVAHWRHSSGGAVQGSWLSRHKPTSRLRHQWLTVRQNPGMSQLIVLLNCKKKTYTKYKQSLKELTSHKYNRTSIAQEYDAGIQIYFLAIIIWNWYFSDQSCNGKTRTLVGMRYLGCVRIAGEQNGRQSVLKCKYLSRIVELIRK